MTFGFVYKCDQYVQCTYIVFRFHAYYVRSLSKLMIYHLLSKRVRDFRNYKRSDGFLILRYGAGPDNFPLYRIVYGNDRVCKLLTTDGSYIYIHGFDHCSRIKYLLEILFKSVLFKREYLFNTLIIFFRCISNKSRTVGGEGQICWYIFNTCV